MRIEVAGIPAPQGSKRHVGGGRMVEVSRAVGPWREAVRAETQRAMKAEGIDGWWPVSFPAPGEVPRIRPVAAQISFRLARPKSAPKFRKYPVTRPDLDKLVRAVLDGLVAGGALSDDSQVVTLVTWKEFATDRKPLGCSITVREWTA